MNWYWLPLLLILIPILFALVPRYRGRGRRVEPPKVYQEAMSPRHTRMRKAEERLLKSDWDVEYAALEVQIALIGYEPLDGNYVSSGVLTYTYEHDREKFDIFMAHNSRLDIQNLGYSGAHTLKLSNGNNEVVRYDAKRHSDYY